MDEYLPHQRYELPTNEWEEEYQGGFEIPKVNDISGIKEDGNGYSYDRYICAKIQLPGGSGNPRLKNVQKHRKSINRESIGNFHSSPFLNTQ